MNQETKKTFQDKKELRKYIKNEKINQLIESVDRMEKTHQEMVKGMFFSKVPLRYIRYYKEAQIMQLLDFVSFFVEVLLLIAIIFLIVVMFFKVKRKY